MESCSGRIDEGGGACHTACHHFTFVGKKRVQRGKPDLERENTEGSREEAVCDPSENSTPEDHYLVEYGGVRHEEVGSVFTDGEN